MLAKLVSLNLLNRDLQLIVHQEVSEDRVLVFWGETKWTQDLNGDTRVEGKTSKNSLVQNRKKKCTNYKLM